MKIKELERIIRMSWRKETCIPSLQQLWKEENPSLGQCAITSLVINDYVGGKIMRCMCSTGSHYYNLINGDIVDLTSEQFGDEKPLYEEASERTREYLLSNDDTKRRYIMLLHNIKQHFEKYGEQSYKLLDEGGKEYISKIPVMYGGNKKLKNYGKMDCSSALSWIKKGYYINNRVFFEDEETAILAGYRPCSKCMPKEYEDWQQKENKTKKLLLKK